MGKERTAFPGRFTPFFIDIYFRKYIDKPNIVCYFY